MKLHNVLACDGYTVVDMAMTIVSLVRFFFEDVIFPHVSKLSILILTSACMHPGRLIACGLIYCPCSETIQIPERVTLADNCKIGKILHG